MAQTLASLDELSGGRMVLCPGAATALHARRFGFPPVDPPTALTEWVEAIRLVLTGERVSYKGTTVAFEDAELGWTPLAAPDVPLWIAALAWLRDDSGILFPKPTVVGEREGRTRDHLQADSRPREALLAIQRQPPQRCHEPFWSAPRTDSRPPS